MTTAIAMMLCTGTGAAAQAVADPACSPEKFEKSSVSDKRETALKAIHSCLERDADNPRLHIALGHLLLAGNELGNAQAAYQQALRIDPSSNAAITSMATILSRQGKLQEAENMLLQLLPTTPRPARIYFELGRLYEQQGNQSKALATYKQGIKTYEQGRRK